MQDISFKKDLIEYLVATYSHILSALFFGFLPIITISIFVTALLICYQSFRKIESIWEISLVFSVSGSVLGLLLGSSREPAVTAFLPAIISLIAGAIFFVLPKENSIKSLILLTDLTEGASESKYKAEFVVGSIVALMLSSSMGSYWGASMRGIANENERRYNEWLYDYENVEIPLKRKSVGLIELQPKK